MLLIILLGVLLRTSESKRQQTSLYKDHSTTYSIARYFLTSINQSHTKSTKTSSFRPLALRCHDVRSSLSKTGLFTLKKGYKMRTRGKVRETNFKHQMSCGRRWQDCHIEIWQCLSFAQSFYRGIANNELGISVNIEFCLFVCFFAVRHQRTQNYNKRSCWLTFLYGLNGNGQVN